mmetsp:Transcript_49975/g.161707  ORF Transcript_49975/g.161707 Transcript_49975/m.161707 type:complete len:423 (-) Transcript_49975:101-1369(-)
MPKMASRCGGAVPRTLCAAVATSVGLVARPRFCDASAFAAAPAAAPLGERRSVQRLASQVEVAAGASTIAVRPASALSLAAPAASAAVACAAAVKFASAFRRSRRPTKGRRSVVACAAEEGEAKEAAKEGSPAKDKAPAEEGAAKKEAKDKALAEEEEEFADGDEEDVAEIEDATEVEDKEKKEDEKAKKWECSSCNALNFAKATECHKCDAPKPSDEELELRVEKQAAQKEVSKVMDEFIRLQADLQNYRREHEGSMTRSKGLGKQDALRKLVPFTKDIEKAMVPPENMSEKEGKIFESYCILFKKILKVWDKFDAREMEVTVGDKLDPTKHRKAESREVEGTPGTILEVLEPGWMLEGKVLVEAEVAIVAFPKEEKKVEKPKEVKKEEEKDEQAGGEAAEGEADVAEEKAETPDKAETSQ